jgi:hypothetical protein
MSENNDKLDFSMILASAVHDMKNSLSMLLSALSALESRYPKPNDEDNKQRAILQYEASRLNSALVQLLGLYKLDNQQLPVNINYIDVEDFLYDQIAQYEPLLKSKNIAIEIEVDDELDACFDQDLVASVINNILGNAIRYTQQKIKLTAYYENGLVFEIADDGVGYPNEMIEKQQNYIKSIDYSTGSTGLGLYFASKIAELHKNKGRCGSIELANGGELGGGIFRLKLP